MVNKRARLVEFRAKRLESKGWRAQAWMKECNMIDLEKWGRAVRRLLERCELEMAAKLGETD